MITDDIGDITQKSRSIDPSMTHSITASAPATLMIMGEHAVLEGEPCLVSAIQKRLRITLTDQPLSPGYIEITSALGYFHGSLDDLQRENSFRFIAGALERYRSAIETMTTGLHLEVHADFSSTVGFGSSAAVLVATLAVLSRRFDTAVATPEILLKEARDVLQAVQGRGSGADLAAAIYGGLIRYQLDFDSDDIRQLASPTLNASGAERRPFAHIQRLPHPPTPTSTVIQQVQTQKTQEPERFKALFRQIGHSVDLATHAAQSARWPDFFKAIDDNQCLMIQIGVSDAQLDVIFKTLTENHRIPLHPKISGSGLGDCMIAFGPVSPNLFQDRPEVIVFPLEWESQGVMYHDTP
jgi:mevalonate kinase